MFTGETDVRALIGAASSVPPAYLRSPEWQRVSNGLVAFAMDNHEDFFTKIFESTKPQDFVIRTLLQDVNSWTLSIDNNDDLTLRLEAACNGDEGPKTVIGTVNALLKALQIQVADGADDPTFGPMAKDVFKNIKVEQKGRAVSINSKGFGTFAASLIGDGIKVYQELRETIREATETLDK